MSDNTKKIGIYIFRKDLRIKDNRGLIKFSKLVSSIIPVFIFDPHQAIRNNKNKDYFSYPALRFLCESIIELEGDIKSAGGKMYIYMGSPWKVVESIIEELKKKGKDFCFGMNEDYTEYSLYRDNLIIDECNKNDIDIYTNDDDYTLLSSQYLLRDADNKIPYKQYGAFRKNMMKYKSKFNKVDNSKITFCTNVSITKINKIDKIKDINDLWKALKAPKVPIEGGNTEPVEIGGRKEGLIKLSKINNFKEYNTKRDSLDYETTRLSAYLNFGCISEREFYEKVVNKLGSSSLLINQIIWRDYYHIMLRFLPNASSYINHIDDRYNKLKWLSNESTLTKRHKQSQEEWKIMMNSKTGFLLVDAAIQEIIHTGYMHNRCRLLVGAFSVKYLLINPLCRYYGLHDWFSRHLVDCSTSQNKLNAQWITELDFPGKKFSPSGSTIAGRPMTIDNSMIKKWDPDCVYIKKWLPHLTDVPNKELYKWNDAKQIFDPKERYKEWILLCKN